MSNLREITIRLVETRLAALQQQLGDNPRIKPQISSILSLPRELKHMLEIEEFHPDYAEGLILFNNCQAIAESLLEDGMVNEAQEVFETECLTVIDDDGKEVVCNVLFTFDNADESRHYIVYTDNSKDNEGNVQVYASRYDPQSGDKMELLLIETEEEWTTIQGILEDLQNKIKNGEPIDFGDEDDEDDEEDEVLESLPFVIWKSMSDWSDRLHFPVGALLPYIIGVILLRLVCPTPLPIRADIGFVLVELLLMRICYDDVEDTHVAVSWCIIMPLRGCSHVRSGSFGNKAFCRYIQRHICRNLGITWGCYCCVHYPYSASCMEETEKAQSLAQGNRLNFSYRCCIMSPR
mgnify:CR=1 FL=1